MKIQDVLFLIVLMFLLYKRDAKLLVWVGLAALVISIPLFARHVFFTAERLTWYGGGLFLVAVVLDLVFLYKGRRS